MTPAQEKTRRSLIGKTETRTEAEKPYTNPLLAVIAEAQRAMPYIERDRPGDQEPLRINKRAASLRNLMLVDTPVRVDRNGRVMVGSNGNSAGQTITISDAIFQNSRFAQAGGNLVFLADHAQPQIIETFSDTKLMGTYTFPKSFVVVDPAALAEIDDDTDQAVSDLPMVLSEINRDNQRSFGVTFKLTRAQQKARGEQQTADELMCAIVTGLARVVDKLAVEAILANTPAAFSLASAATAGLRIGDLRGLVGTDGTGATFRADGQLVVAGGIEAELTPVTDQTIVGAFDRAAALIGTDMAILCNRLNKNGDVTVSAWLSVDAVCPDAGKFWTVA